MPKKTKKEKLLASKRRSQFPPVVIEAGNVNSPQEQATPGFFTFSPANISTPKTHAAASSTPQYLQIKRDLIKTVFITAIILVSEVLLTRWLPQ